MRFSLKAYAPHNQIVTSSLYSFMVARELIFPNDYVLSGAAGGDGTCATLPARVVYTKHTNYAIRRPNIFD